MGLLISERKFLLFIFGCQYGKPQNCFFFKSPIYDFFFFFAVIVSRGRCRRCGFDPWIGKIPWKKKWQPTPVFLPGKCHGQRSLVGCSPWGHKRVRHN